MSKTAPLPETARKLGEARRVLEGVEATVLGGVAQMLAQTAESLARTARELKGIAPDEWLTFEAAAYLQEDIEGLREGRRQGRDPQALPDRAGHPFFP